jgi:hypothetical protein
LTQRDKQLLFKDRVISLYPTLQAKQTAMAENIPRLDCIQKMQILEDNFKPHKLTLQQYLEKCSEKYNGTPYIPLAQGQAKFALNQK